MGALRENAAVVGMVWRPYDGVVRWARGRDESACQGAVLPIERLKA